MAFSCHLLSSGADSIIYVLEENRILQLCLLSRKTEEINN